MKYKVRALDTYRLLNVKDEELNRIPNEGEEIEVSETRLNKLLGNNKFNVAFVEVIELDEQIENAKLDKENISKKSGKNVEKRPLQK